MLEEANIKLASVITNIDGKTGLSILTVIIELKEGYINKYRE